MSLKATRLQCVAGLVSKGRFSRTKSEVLDLGNVPPFTVGFASLGQWVREGYPTVSVFGAEGDEPE